MRPLLPVPHRAETGDSTGRSLKGLNVGGAKPEKRLNVGRGKKQKSRVEVELKSSAAVPCHISAEHDSRTLKCGNALGSSPRIQTRLQPLRIPHDPGFPTAGSQQRRLAAVCRAQPEIGRPAEVHPRRARTGQPSATQRTHCDRAESPLSQLGLRRCDIVRA